MAWFEREFLAVPEDRKNQLVFKWPDVSIRRFSRVIVNADEVALFVNAGRVTDVMGPGRHRVDANELPGLGALIDTLSGSNAYRAELYFLRTKEFPGNKFGGRLDDIIDPRTEQVVTLRVFGEYALAVRDPVELITGLTGTVDLADPATVPAWCSDLLLRSMKVAATQGITQGKWPILGLSAYLPEIDLAVREVADRQLSAYGLRITRLGNFDINLAPDDADRLKRLAKDRTYIELAGGFQPYAAGELALGASKGLALGGGGEAGFLGAALGLGAIQQQLGTPARAQAPVAHARASSPQRPDTVPAALPAAGPICAACNAANPAKARFCTQCGERLAAAPRRCADCAAELAPTARFCGTCGAPSTG